jgi:predicted ATPase/DNA-binding XRE family transcriptional regulator
MEATHDEGEARPMSNRAYQPAGRDTFGTLLRQYRVAAGLTQEALAEKAGLSARGISDLERELIRFPRRDTLQLLLQALALPGSDEAILKAAALRPLPGSAPSAEWASETLFPETPGPLFGRAQEVENAGARLEDPHVRWLTLTGPGGVGKSSLALAAAMNAKARGLGTAYWVGLAHVRDSALVMPTVAQALHVPDDPAMPSADRLANAIADRRALLVVDNLEQVADSAPLLAGLLTRCPNLKILATSRVRLRVRAEHVLPVAPLPLPPGEWAAANVEAVAANPAVALFVARTMAVNPDFTLAPGNAATVAAICRQLDGLPLALELAAARTTQLPPEALLHHLEHRLDLLSSGYQDAPDRQRTMRNAIVWSYELLPVDAQVLLRRAAVFTGGFSLDALAGVTHLLESSEASQDSRGLLEAPPTLSLINTFGALIDASLVQPQDGVTGQARYRMLETVREFAVEQLAASDEESSVRNAHAAWFSAVAAVRLKFPDMWTEDPVILAQIHADMANLRGAMEWLAVHGPAESGLVIAQGVGLAAIFLGNQGQALAWIDRFLTPDRVYRWDQRMRALIVRSMLRRHRRLEAESANDADEALALTDGHDPIARAAALYMVGTSRRSLPELETALATCRDLPEGRAMASMTLMQMSLHAVQAEHDHERARTWVEAGLGMLEPGPTVGHLIMVGNLSTLMHETGDVRRAASLHRQSLLLNRRAQSLRLCASGLTTASEYALERGRPALAARLLGASFGLQDRIGAIPERFNVPFLEALTESMRNALGADAFAVAVEAGRALEHDEAMDEALRLYDEIADTPPE